MELPQLPMNVRAKIESDVSAEDAGRLTALLTFWGNLGAEPIDAVVLKAFSHGPIPPGILTESVANQDSDVDDGVPQLKPRDDVRPSVQRQIRAIEEWSQGKVLPQEVARDLRGIIQDALLARIDWLDIVIKEPDAATLNKAVPKDSRGISIEGANENIPLGVEPLVRFKRSAQTATVFIGLIYVKAGLPQRAGNALPRLDTIVSKSVDEAGRRILVALAVDDASLASAAASLIRGAAACGVLAAKPKEIDFINACLWLPTTSARDDTSTRATEWTAAYREYIASRTEAVKRLVNGVGAAQGDRGAVHALDIRRLSAIIKRAARLASSDDDIDVPVWCADTKSKLKVLMRAAPRQVLHWKSLVDRARQQLPEGVTLIETVDAITEAARAGQGHGLVKVPDLHKLGDINTAARTFDGGSLKTIERLLADAESAATSFELLQVVGTIAGMDLASIAEYLEDSERWVDAGLREANSGSGAIADLDVEIEKTIVRWSGLVKESTGE